ncbi:tyrosine-type recombinase/integrase [Bacillus wiedmannii]|uniref:DNA integration/recombination/invertion protein n=1 Tax=Bacillus wiedmannii TaxID=1890302 RepID=A0A1C4ETI0_9BACI|nr:tyrosine-type recombinase/integrase [Bacillus wiedmannii]SCC46887.1 DNA integration/recombination/invertion protein [Bacillus wiedmannii]
MKGHIRKRGNKYCIVIDIGPDPQTGKRRQKWFSGYRTKKEAQADVAKKVTELNEGTFVEPSKLTLKDYLLEWLKVKEMTIDKSTFDYYEDIVLKHILPALGKIYLNKLNVIQVQQFYRNLTNTLSNGRILLIHRVLNNALNQAVAQKIIIENPAKFASKPKKEKTPIQIWTEEEVKRFLFHSQDSRYHIGYILAITTGMRLGEVLGLRWQDIDFDNHTLTITNTVGHDNKIKQGAKTNFSQRTMPIPVETINALKSHNHFIKKEKLRLGNAYNDFDLIVCTTRGGIVSRNYFRTKFYEVIKKADVSKIKFHDLRHTHASLLLKQGVHPKIVSERLGHTNVSVTLNIYSHVLPNIQEEAVAKFAKSIFG